MWSLEWYQYRSGTVAVPHPGRVQGSVKAQGSRSARAGQREGEYGTSNPPCSNSG